MIGHLREIMGTVKMYGISGILQEQKVILQAILLTVRYGVDRIGTLSWLNG
jgi:hypothetical protein